jgi:hypothetical protein
MRRAWIARMRIATCTREEGNMVSKAELLAWVNTLSDESCIGIDEGGNVLAEVLANDTLGAAYIEIGGIPEEVEHAD